MSKSFNISSLAKSFKHGGNKVVNYVVKHAPAILTGIGAVSSVAGAIYAGKAAVKAHYILKEKHEAEAEAGIEMKKHEQVFSDVTAVAKTFAPAVVLEAVAVGCIFGSYKISRERLLGACALLAVNRDEFKDYREKVKEMFGEDKEKEVNDAVVKQQLEKGSNYHDVIKREDDPELATILGSSDIQRFKDSKSMQKLISSKSKIREAVSDFNERFDQGEMWQSLNDFYGYLGLEYTDVGDRFQFTGDRRLEIEFGEPEIDPKDGLYYIPIQYDIFDINGKAI